MAEFDFDFEHNGYGFSFFENDEVKLTHLPEVYEIYISKYAIFNDKHYKVIGIEPAKMITYHRFNKETDGRKKPKYQTSIYYQTINVSGNEIDCYSYKDSGNRDTTKIHFHDGIQFIGDYTFESFLKINNIELPSQLNRIGKRAFYRCLSLETIYLPGKLLSIGARAFAYTALEDITIPDSVAEIGREAFWECDKLTNVTIGSGIKMIGEKAFGACVSLKSVDIYADPFEVMIAPNAFPSHTQVCYHNPDKARKKYISQSKKEELSRIVSLLCVAAENKPNVIEEQEAPSNKGSDIDLEKLMSAVLVDGVVTDKERSVLLKKAKAARYDTDEVEILLDAKLYEAQQKFKNEKSLQCSSQPKSQEEEPKVKVENAKLKQKQEDSADSDNISWAEILWTPLKDHLDKVSKIKGSKPADRSYTIYKIKSIDAQIVPWYREKSNEAGVALETYGGDEVKVVIEKILAKAPADSIVRQAELSQGKKNKDKWNWTVVAAIDKNDESIIQWYADAILAFDSLIEG